MNKLNLGCGLDVRPGYINIDNRNLAPGVVIADIEKPAFWKHLKDNQFDKIIAHHTLEHVFHMDYVVTQIYRTLRPGGVLSLKSPHFTHVHLHPYHYKGFCIGYFKHLNNYHPEIKFEHLVRPRLRYTTITVTNWTPINIFKYCFIHGLGVPLTVIANLSPGLCERVWGYWFGGFEEVAFKVRAIK